MMVDHFSKITMFLSRGWSEVVGIASEIKRVLGLGSIGDPPVCDKSNTEAKATVASEYIANRPSEKNFRVDVCTERADKRARLKLVNRRPVAVRIQAPQATLVDRTIPGAGELASIAVSALAKPLGGNEGALIPPGGQIVLEFPDEVQTFPMSIDPGGIAWSVLFAAAGGIPGGWKALADSASAIDFAGNGANAGKGRGWEDLVRQGLAKFLEALAKTATGVLKAVLRLAAGMISTIILAIRGVLDIYVSMSGSAFANASYLPATASKPFVPADLLSAPVPSLCGHPAGRLVNGTLPGIGPTMGFVSLMWTGGEERGAIAVGNLDGKPGDEIAAVVGCSQGGIGHPSSVQIYGPGPALLGSVNLNDIVPVVGQAILRDIAYSDGSILIRWATGRAGDCLCLPTINAQARARLSGTQLVIEDVRTSPANDAPVTTTSTTTAPRAASGCPIAGATGRYVATMAVGGVSCERVSTVWAAYEKAGGPAKTAQGVVADWGCVFPRAEKVGVIVTCVSDSDGTAFDVSKA